MEAEVMNSLNMQPVCKVSFWEKLNNSTLICLWYGQGNMATNIYRNIYLKICDNNITDDMIDARQNTLQLYNFISFT